MSRPESPLAHPVAVVTGASGALGTAIVRELVQRGHRVVAGYRSGAASVAALVDELGAERVEPAYADLADRAAGEMLLAAASRWGTPTVLVNNAGAMTQTPVEHMADDEWDRLIDVNLSSCFRLTRACIPGMRAAGGGRIVNISSQAAYRGSIGRAHYSAAKAGLLGLTFALARELGDAAITVNAVVPGRIESDMLAEHTDPERMRAWIADTPLGRLGRPEELASSVGYLVSDEAAYITGAALQVGGGLVMG